MYDVYILLTRSTTYFSRLIRLVTTDEYTHASIGFDGINGEFYSFGRKNSHLILPAGFVIERIQTKQIYSGMTYYTLYKVQVSKTDYDKIIRYIKSIYKNNELYSYNILGVLATFFGLVIQRQHHFYCSQFVAKALSNSKLGKYIESTDKIKPADLSSIPNIQVVSYGYIGGLGRVEEHQALKQLNYKDN